MTGDERLAKVAEVLAGHEWTYPDAYCECDSFVSVPSAYKHHVAQALAPLLDEFRAEALREAADDCESLIADALGRSHGDFADGWRDASRLMLEEMRGRATLAAAEPDAGAR